MIVFTTLISGCHPGMDSVIDDQIKMDTADEYFNAIKKKDVAIMDKVLDNDFVSYGPDLKILVKKTENISD